MHPELTSDETPDNVMRAKNSFKGITNSLEAFRRNKFNTSVIPEYCVRRYAQKFP